MGGYDGGTVTISGMDVAVGGTEGWLTGWEGGTGADGDMDVAVSGKEGWLTGWEDYLKVGLGQTVVWT